jgi:hypothetical protein
MKRPTKNVDDAIRRLRAHADVLVCQRIYPGYDGSIHRDILAVLKLIDDLRATTHDQ